MLSDDKYPIPQRKEPTPIIRDRPNEKPQPRGRPGLNGQKAGRYRKMSRMGLHAADNSIGSTIEGSSFSGLLTRVEIGNILIGSGSLLSQRLWSPGASFLLHFRRPSSTYPYWTS
jgi:hypothetical protein